MQPSSNSPLHREVIPKGGWRGGEDIPKGGWRGGEDIPKGGWRGGEDIPKGGWRGGEDIPKGGWRGGEDIPKGGWRVTRDVYRTNDGDGYFTFEFYEIPGSVEIHIVESPSYGQRASDLHTTHRLPCSHGGYKVCLADPSEASTLGKARKFAESWAELTWRYIRTGERF